MKLRRPRRVIIQVGEFQDNRMVAGSSRRLTLYETSSDEVMAVIRQGVEAACDDMLPSYESDLLGTVTVPDDEDEEDR